MGRGTPHTKSRRERGYDAEYDRARVRAKTKVEAGQATCWRCGSWLNPTLPWHLGHDDNDRRIIRGPECVRCNLGAAARKTNAIRRAKSARRKAMTIRSREW
jgi:NAD-dependent dihydropyrimidine dehydrogenase PreA subunit